MSMKSTRIAIVRVSPKAGNVKHLWIYEERRNGWIQGGPDQSYSPGRSFASWHAPHHVLKIVDIGTVSSPRGSSYDWNGIQPGTLVEMWDGSYQGIVIDRKGAKYVILRNGDPRPIEVTWESVVPVDHDDTNGATA
jgi:hypothetical protein